MNSILEIVGGLAILLIVAGFYSGVIRLTVRIEPDEQEDCGCQAELRPEVLSFAMLMEQYLRDKDADKGQRWKSKSKDHLLIDANMKYRMLETSIQRNLPHYVDHAVDLANYCMMIVDVSGVQGPCAVKASHA